MRESNMAVKRIFTLFLAFAMIVTSIFVPTKTVSAATSKSVKSADLLVGSTKVTKKKITLFTGESGTFKVSVNPSSAKKAVTFKSNKPAVVSVNKAGKFSAKKTGKATVTAYVTAKDGKRKALQTSVTVAKSFKLKKASYSVAAGHSVTVQANVQPFHKATFKSANTKIAKVNSKGVVTGVKAGTTKITVKIGKVSATAKVVVKKGNDGITIKLNHDTLSLKKGESETLVATVSPASASQKVTWRAADSKIVSVDNGVVTANEVGYTTVYATAANGAEAKCKVTVTGKNNDLQIKVTNALGQYSSEDKNVLMMGNDANVTVTYGKNGSPQAQQDLKIELKPQYGNASDVYTIKGENAKLTTYEKTNTKGIVTIPIGKIAQYNNVTAFDGMYASYTLKVTSVADDSDTASTAICFAAIDYATPDSEEEDALYVANQYDDKLPELEASTNATTANNIAHTRSKNGVHGVQYVTSQQVSAETKSHAVTFAIVPTLIIPATESEIKVGDYEDDSFAKQSGAYSVYNDETNTSTTTKIETIPAGLEWATIQFNSIKISKYTKIQVKFFDKVTKVQIGDTVEINTDSFDENSKMVQVPKQRDHDVYAQIALISAGQVDEDSNDGYDVAKIVGQWASTAKDFYSYVGIADAVTWTKDETFARDINKELSAAEAAKYLPANSQYATGNYTYKFSVPAFPHVGNGLIKVKDANGNDAATFLYPTENILGSGTYQNENTLQKADETNKAINASADEENNKVDGNLTNFAVNIPNGDKVIVGNGVTVDSIKSGYTPLKVTLDYEKLLGIKKEDGGLVELYTSVQWSPVKNQEEVLDLKDFYAVKGQKVKVTAQLYDEHGNKVTQEGKEIKFQQGKETALDSNFIVANKEKYITDKQGQVVIDLKNPSSAKLVLEDLNAVSENYNVRLQIGDETNVEHANIYWIDLGLYFCNDVLDEDEKSQKQGDFIETEHSKHAGVVETRTFTGNRTIGKYTEKTATTATGDKISLAREAGQTWILGTPVVGKLPQADTKLKVQKVTGVTVNFDKTGKGEKVSEDNEKGIYTVKSNEAGDSTVTGTINSSSVTGHDVVFYIGDDEHEPVAYKNVGYDVAEVNASIGLVLNWNAVGQKLEVITPLGQQLDITTASKVYFSLKDSFGNPLKNKTITYSIASTDITSGVVEATTTTTNDNGIAEISVPAPNAAGTLNITASYDNVTATASIIYSDSRITDAFTAKKATLNRSATPYTITVEFSHAINAATLSKDAFRIYKKDSAAKDPFRIASAEVVAGHDDTVLLTLDGEGLKDVDAANIAVAINAYKNADGIEYQITDGNHRVLPAETVLTVEEKKN